MLEVEVGPLPLERLAEVLPPERIRRLAEQADAARALLDGRTVWNLNSTAQGGGVAEMLQTLLAYGRGAGVDTRWLVLNGDSEFFAITKRLHNFLHGSPGDGGDLGEAERAHYSEIVLGNLHEGPKRIKAGDIVLLHDPQTAGLVDELKERGAHVIWRSHIGSDFSNDYTDRGWEFLREFVKGADAFVFSRAEYVPPWVPRVQTRIIPPSLDPFSAKNTAMTEPNVRAALHRAGLVSIAPDGGSFAFVRRDGSAGELREHRGLVLEDEALPGDARVVLQVSRWDRLKDMGGVLRGFAEHLDQLPADAHLLLVGPDVSGVTDDPEGLEVLDDCLAQRRALPDAARARVHLCCLPMDDGDENAYLVNALQRYATVVVQKSLVEGFGLTVTEPMWKGKPVVASAVGGISDQIVDGESGVLLVDPRDLSAYVAAVGELLTDQQKADRLGAAAHERVLDRFLGDRHLIQYVELFGELVNGHP